jgi:hypothetical protein
MPLDRELCIHRARNIRDVLEKPYPAKFTCYVGSNLVEVKRRRPVSKQFGGGDRGKIKGFSRNSARRLMYTVNKIRRDELPFFVTLTYADTYESFNKPAQWKRDLDNLGKRLIRAYPKTGGIWRLDMVDRKSGIWEGEVRPHYHLLVYGVPRSELLEFRAWVAAAWNDLVNTGIEKSIRTQVQAVRSINGVNSYAAKGMSSYVTGELAKFTQALGEGVGRWWGVISRDNIPWGEYLDLLIPDKVAKTIIRIFRKSILKKRRGSGRHFHSLTVFANADFWKAAVPKFIELEYG